MPTLKTTLSAAVLAAAGGVCQATALRVAIQRDALSMDRHSLNESLQWRFTGKLARLLPVRGKQLERLPDNNMPYRLITLKLAP